MFFIPFVIFLLTSVSYGSYVDFDVRHERGVSDHAISGISGITNFTFTDNAAVSMRGWGLGSLPAWQILFQNIYMGLKQHCAMVSVVKERKLFLTASIAQAHFRPAQGLHFIACRRLGMPIRKARWFTQRRAQWWRYIVLSLLLIRWLMALTHPIAWTCDYASGDGCGH